MIIINLGTIKLIFIVIKKFNIFIFFLLHRNVIWGHGMIGIIFSPLRDRKIIWLFLSFKKNIYILLTSSEGYSLAREYIWTNMTLFIFLYFMAIRHYWTNCTYNKHYSSVVTNFMVFRSHLVWTRSLKLDLYYLGIHGLWIG